MRDLDVVAADQSKIFSDPQARDVKISVPGAGLRVRSRQRALFDRVLYPAGTLAQQRSTFINGHTQII